MKLSLFKRLFLGIFSGACVLLPSAILLADATPKPKELSIQAVHFDVPFEKQEEPRDCGLAVLKTIFSFYGQKLNQAQIDWVKTNSKAGEGTMASELVIVLNEADFETALYQGTLDKEATGLFRQIDKHRPVIVMITSEDGKDSHYDVVCGYDPIRGYILLMDPALGPLTVSQSKFTAAWKRANNLTLVAVPKKLLPPTPTPQPSAGSKN